LAEIIKLLQAVAGRICCCSLRKAAIVWLQRPSNRYLRLFLWLITISCQVWHMKTILCLW